MLHSAYKQFIDDNYQCNCKRKITETELVHIEVN